MLEQKQCYAQLVEKADYLHHYCWWLQLHAPEWQEHFGFDAIELNQNVLDEVPVLARVHELNPIARMGVLRVKSNTFYDWHVDESRLCCINLLLNNFDCSYTLFGRQRNAMNKDVLQLKYEKQGLYLFNNQIPHCVGNMGPDRYLFSLYFEEERPYDEVLKEFKRNSLLAEGC